MLRVSNSDIYKIDVCTSNLRLWATVTEVFPKPYDYKLTRFYIMHCFVSSFDFHFWTELLSLLSDSPIFRVGTTMNR